MQTAFSETLPCELTEAERASKAQEMARAVRQYEVYEQEKKARAAQASKILKEARRRIDELAKEVRDGVEYREIQCLERHSNDPSLIDVVRLDDGTVFRRRPVTDEERQVTMFTDAVLGRGKGKGKLAPVPDEPPDNDNNTTPRNTKH